MNEPLTGTQADEVREIAMQEVARFADLLWDEIGRAPDGSLSPFDLRRCITDASRRASAGEVAR